MNRALLLLAPTKWTFLAALLSTHVLSAGAESIPATAPVASKTSLSGPTADAASRLIVPNIDFREATIHEALDLLRTKAWEHSPEGHPLNVILNLRPNTRPPLITLKLKDVSLLEAARSISAETGLELSLEPGALAFGIAPPKVSMPKPSAAWKKAQALIIPKLEFRQASALQAVEFLKRKAAELDPGKVGVSLVVKPCPENFSQTTLSLKQISLAEALRYVAGATGMELVARADALVLQAREGKAMKPPRVVGASVRREGSVILAKGHAVLSDEWVTIAAEDIRYDTVTGRTQAAGNAELWHGEELIRGDDLQLGLGLRGQFVAESGGRSTVVLPLSNLGTLEPGTVDIMATFLKGVSLRGEGDARGAARQYEKAVEKIDSIKTSDVSAAGILQEFRAIILEKQKNLENALSGPR